MFGMKRRAAERAAKAAQDRKGAEAEQMGRDFGEAMSQAVDQFIATRARPVGEKVFEVYIGLTSNPKEEGGGSPIDVARADSRVFVDHLNRQIPDPKTHVRPGTCRSFEIDGWKDETCKSMWPPTRNSPRSSHC